MEYIGNLSRDLLINTSICCGPAGLCVSRELLRPFGLDASNPTFGKEAGLDVVRGMIDELEAMP